MKRIYPFIFNPGTEVILVRHDLSQAQENREFVYHNPDVANGVAMFATPRMRQCIRLLHELCHNGDSTILTCSSPYLRAVETHQQIIDLIAEDTNSWLDLGQRIALREIALGHRDGRTLDQLKEIADEDELFEMFMQIVNKHFTPTALEAGAEIVSPHLLGESYAQVHDRLLPELEILAQTMQFHGSDKLLITSHGGTMRMIVAAIFGLDAKEASSLRNPDNCEIWKISISVGANPTPHLLSVTNPGNPIFKSKVSATLVHGHSVSP